MSSKPQVRLAVQILVKDGWQGYMQDESVLGGQARVI
jgi:hypothetical protein